MIVYIFLWCKLEVLAAITPVFYVMILKKYILKSKIICSFSAQKHFVSSVLKTVVLFKGNFHPKIKRFRKCTYSPAIQDVDEFVSSSEQIWRNLALHYLLTYGSSAVNGCHRMRVQTAVWNLEKIVHTTLAHQLTAYEVKSCICKKQIHQDVFNFTLLFP